MAENESLDLGNPGGQRWHHVYDAVRKRQSPEDVAHKMSRKLPAALRKAFKEFAEMGVTVEMLLRSRHDAKSLDRLVRKCQGHEYAHLFTETAAADTSGDDRQLVNGFLNAVLDRVTDQMIQGVVGTEWPDFGSVRHFFSQVREKLNADLQCIATKLSRNPNWNPTVRNRKKEDAVSVNKDLLNMSMLGIAKQ